MKKLGQLIAWVIILGAIAYDDLRWKIEEFKARKIKKKNEKKNNRF